MIPLFLVLCMVSLAGSAAGAEPGLLTHYAFEEGTGAILHDRGALQEDGRIVGAGWIRSERGAALDFDGVGDFVDCGDPPEGRLAGPLTIVFWVRRTAEKQQYVVQRGGWNVYLLPDGRPVFETRDALNTKWESLVATTGVPLDEWAQVVALFDPDRQVEEVYVNGEMAGSRPRTDGAIGGLFRSKLFLGKQLDGLLGEFRLYNRALSAEEVRGLYKTTAPDPALASPAWRLRVTPHLFHDEGIVIAEVRLNGNREAAGPITGEVRLLPQGSKQVVRSRDISPLESGRTQEIAFPTADLLPGEYEIAVSARDAAGNVLATVSGYFMMPGRPWWYDSRAGLSDEVFAPLTPLDVRHDGARLVVSCWNRTLLFANLPLPEQLVSGKKELLAAPISLAGKADGQDLKWTGGPLAIREVSPAAVVFSSRASSAGIELEAHGTVEYDGLIRVEVTLTPQRTVRLENLRLDIPLRREHASLVYYYRDPRYMASGALPAGGVARDFNPAIWIGDEERGLQWLCESDRDWYHADPARAIEIFPDHDRVVLRLHLVSKAITLAPDIATSTEAASRLSYAFGLQPTPIKPVERDAWDLRISTCHAYGREYFMLTDKVGDQSALDFCAARGTRTLVLFNWTDVLSYPAPINHDEDLRRMVKECHDRGLKVLLYLGCQFSELAPEYAGFFDDFAIWTSPRAFSAYGYLDNYPPMRAQMTYSPCVKSQWRNFIVANAERLMDQYDIDGFYLDGVGVDGQCHNIHHGCGYLHPDGTIHPTHPLWAGRETIRRLYQIVRSRKPDGQIDLHPAAYWSAASVAWATNVWDGETILGEDRKGENPTPGTFLLDIVPLPMFRAQFMGKPWGVPTEFIHYYVPYPIERTLSLTLLHDVTIRAHITPTWLDFMSSLWRLADDFGRKDAEWLPYWRNAEYVAVTPRGTDTEPGAFVSLYRHPRNGVLAVVSNLSRKEENVEVRFNLERLGLTGADIGAADALSGEPLNMENGRIRLGKMESVSWRLVWLKRAGAAQR